MCSKFRTCYYCDRQNFYDKLNADKKKSRAVGGQQQDKPMPNKTRQPKGPRKPPANGSWANVARGGRTVVDKSSGQDDAGGNGHDTKADKPLSRVQRLHEAVQQARKAGDPPEAIEVLEQEFKKAQKENQDAKPPAAQAKNLNSKLNKKKESLATQQATTLSLQEELAAINDKIKQSQEEEARLQAEVAKLEEDEARLKAEHPTIQPLTSILLQGTPDGVRNQVCSQFGAQLKQFEEMFKKMQTEIANIVAATAAAQTEAAATVESSATVSTMPPPPPLPSQPTLPEQLPMLAEADVDMESPDALQTMESLKDEFEGLEPSAKKAKLTKVLNHSRSMHNSGRFVKSSFQKKTGTGSG